MQYVHTCPLVLSQMYHINKLYGNKWVNYAFLPKIILFKLYFSHFTGTAKTQIYAETLRIAICVELSIGIVTNIQHRKVIW